MKGITTNCLNSNTMIESNHAISKITNDDVQLDTHSVSLDASKQNGMVFHHHLDSNKIVDGKLNVEQVALRPGQLDSIRRLTGDNNRDCHRSRKLDRIILDKEIDVNRDLVSNAKDYITEISYSVKNKKLYKYF